MKNNFKFYITIWAIFLVLFNIIAFVSVGWSGVEKYTASFWIGYVFITLAFFGQLICSYLAFKEDNLKKLFYNLPLITISYSGLIMSFVFGALCMIISPLPYWVGILLCAILLAIYAIALVKARAAAAINQFETIKDWKDSQEQIYACQLKIEEIKAKEEADRLENIRIAEEDRLKREHNAEVKRIKEEKRKKRNKKIFVIITAIVAACIVFLVLLKIIIIPAVSYSKAIALYDAGKYNEAITAFESLGSYKDSTTKITECKEAIKEVTYLSAVSLYDAGKYNEAITAFESLGSYKDSTTKITECKEAIKEVTYLSAVSLYDAGKYNEAITAFESLGSYKDSTTKITECKEAIKEVAYLSAVSLYNAGKYKEAKAAFETIKEYKDSIIYLQNASLKSSEVGSYIDFGEYEQDNNTSNNKESIEWQVLAKENNRFLVVSRYALDCKKYNETYKVVTWETCTLRTWLNGSFYDNAFSSSEKAMILSSTIANENNPQYGTAGGNKTTDRVFLLSISEAQKYFSSDYERRTEATAYAVKNGVWVNDSDCCNWWLRSPGNFSDFAAYVLYVGSVYDYGLVVHNDDYAVRPAMWIDISNLEP